MQTLLGLALILLSTGAVAASYSPIPEGDFKKVVEAWNKVPPTPVMPKFDEEAYYKGRCVAYSQPRNLASLFFEVGSHVQLRPETDPVRGDWLRAGLGFMDSMQVFNTRFTFDKIYRFDRLVLLSDGDTGNDKTTSGSVPERTYFAVRMGDGKPIELWTRLYIANSSGTEGRYCYYWTPDTKAPPVVVPPPPTESL